MDQSLDPPAFTFRPTDESGWASSCVFAKLAGVCNPASWDSASGRWPAPRTEDCEQMSPAHTQAATSVLSAGHQDGPTQNSEEGRRTSAVQNTAPRAHAMMVLTLTLPPVSHRTVGSQPPLSGITFLIFASWEGPLQPRGSGTPSAAGMRCGDWGIQAEKVRSQKGSQQAQGRPSARGVCQPSPSCTALRGPIRPWRSRNSENCLPFSSFLILRRSQVLSLIQPVFAACL